VDIPDFATLAARGKPSLDELALALASEFGPVDARAALAELDRLGDELSELPGGSPEDEAEACRQLLGERHRFAGDRERYDHPDNSMLDLVLARRKGLPILLSVVYVETGRRAGIALAGVGLPGHYVVGHFGAEPPLLLDPFGGGVLIETDAPVELVRPWGPHETALRMLNNLVGAYRGRGDLANAIRAAELRLALPVADGLLEQLGVEARALRARLN
jgi:regulator of sirC expression with transglutaminase-like and TPR domain